MNEMQRRGFINDFVKAWKKRGSEKSDARSFWIELLHALGADMPTKILQFEVPVDVDGHKCFIDAWINDPKILIEHKNCGVDLDKPSQQSDGKFLNPFDQAKRYADARDYSERPKWIVVSNFDEIRIYNMNEYYKLSGEDYQPNVIAVDRLLHEYLRLNFLLDPEDENVDPTVKISKAAIEHIKRIRDALKKNRRNDDLSAITKFCVRLMFCCYAQDADIFEPKQFIEYIETKKPDEYRQALLELFDVLDTDKPLRDPDLRAKLKQFPYVNGALFADAADNIPALDSNVWTYIIGAAKFDWIDIDPSITGALFESICHERDARGMHYTSIDNIHRVIDPLFMNALNSEFQAIKRKRINKQLALERFHFKLSQLTFFDPACGSGNFLTETYISIRQLENDVLVELQKFGVSADILVSIENFYGIEINDFAVAIARTALWIAESQMIADAHKKTDKNFELLPLKSTARIVCGNALRLDWHDIVPDGADYIIGNPPFVGYSFQSTEQKADLLAATNLNNKKLDYVVGWFYKAAEFMVGTGTRAAFVSTNSIVQGEQTAAVWKKLFETVHIDFAYRTFKWISESENMAAVHCVVIGFSAAPNDAPKIIFDGDRQIIAENINAYLLDGPNYFIDKRKNTLCDVPSMTVGNRPADGGNLIIEADDYDQFIRREPRAQKFIRRLIGAEEFINGKPRYCLWLKDATADDLKLPLIAQRVEGCRRDRLKGAADRQKLAATPHLFREQLNPQTMIVVPSTSSENRQYIPMGFMLADTIATNAMLIIPDAGLFEFGVLESSLHMAWTRVVCGRLKSDYRYSKDIVYNNFPWCARSARIEQTARGILDARKKYPKWTLAALYDPNTMPVELRTAHEANDREVLAAYEFDAGMSELELVSRLMAMYQALAEKN